MINVYDLRLGNLLIWNPKLSNPGITLQPMIVEIAAVAPGKIGYTPYKLGQRVEPFEDDLMVAMETAFKPNMEFEPVELTFDILEKSGFSNESGMYRLNGFYPQIINRHTNWFAVLIPGTLEIELKYLHQLQNLYYAMVGEELEILI